jgi:hypothetical protein
MYNKLFTKILDSSIWLESLPVRVVWITLLAAMDEEGYAHFSAVANLARRANVPEKDAQKAVDILLAPDPHSGDPEFEGRRIERVPGGFFILNAKKHRQLYTREVQREKTRGRVNKHRDRMRAIEKQRNCGCCSKPFIEPYSINVVLDHDHSTLLTRSFVCISCNKLISQQENGTTILDANKQKMAEMYLERYKSVTQALHLAYDNDSASEEGFFSEREESERREIFWTKANGFSGITEKDHSEWKEAYPACDITRQLAAMHQWLLANPAKAKKSNWRKFVTNWLLRQQDRGGDAPRGVGSFQKSKPLSRQERINKLNERKAFLMRQPDSLRVRQEIVKIETDLIGL